MATASSDTRSVYERMVAIIDELPAIGKTQRNTQQNFNFRGHDDVLNALTPLLAKHGVLIVPNVLERVTDQRTTAKGTAMYEVNLHVQFTCYGKTGDSLTGSAWGEGTDMGDKSTMKAGTMAFKAFLNQTFAINTQEGAAHDTDKTTVEETVVKRKPSPMTAEQKTRVAELLAKPEISKSKVEAACQRDYGHGTDALNGLEAATLIAQLEKFLESQAVPA